MAGKGSLGGRAASPAAVGHNLGLFGPGGPFEHFPGPVLVVGYNRTVVTGNRAAEPLAEALRLSRAPELADAVSAALGGAHGQITLAIPQPLSPVEAVGELAMAGEPPIYRLDVLPWANGAAALLMGRDVTLEQVQQAALRRELARCRHHETVSGRLLRLLRASLPPRGWPPMLLKCLPPLLDLSGLLILRREKSEFAELAVLGLPPGTRGRRLLARLEAAGPEQSVWEDEEEGDFCALLPLVLRKSVTGALFCRRPRESGSFDAAELAFLAALAGELASALAGDFKHPPPASDRL